jgi:hypothetical protein
MNEVPAVATHMRVRKRRCCGRRQGKGGGTSEDVGGRSN